MSPPEPTGREKGPKTSNRPFDGQKREISGEFPDLHAKPGKNDKIRTNPDKIRTKMQKTTKKCGFFVDFSNASEYNRE